MYNPLPTLSKGPCYQSVDCQGPRSGEGSSPDRKALLRSGGGPDKGSEQGCLQAWERPGFKCPLCCLGLSFPILVVSLESLAILAGGLFFLRGPHPGWPHLDRGVEESPLNGLYHRLGGH